MDVPEPFRIEGDHIAFSHADAHALFTTRRGGVSEGPYESLNLSPWTEDDPDAVRANRERLADLAGVAHHALAQGRQVHESTVERVTLPPSGRVPNPADGQATNLPGVAAVV